MNPSPYRLNWRSLVGAVLLMSMALGSGMAGILWAQTQLPASDVRGSMLIDIIDTLERDLGELSQKRREVARLKEQLEKRIGWVERRVGKLDSKVSVVRKQISSMVRSLIHMRQPDDLLLFFSTGRYHDLFVYRRLVSSISISLLQKMQRTLRDGLGDRRKLATLKEELGQRHEQQASIDQELYEVEGLIGAKKAELSDRQAKIAAVETLFMTQSSRSPKLAPDVVPGVVEPGLGALAEAKGKRSLQIPISPGRVIKAYDRPAAAPYGNQKMDRGWVLVPLLKEAKRKPVLPEQAYIRTPAAGKAVFQGEVPGFGLTLVLEHQKKYHSVYSNLHRVLVTKGETVKEGQAIGTIHSAEPGKVLPYLYFELREDRLPVDPRDWFRLRALVKGDHS